jgi:hypothetical protein
MNQDLTASYELVSDIDCSKTTELNGGKGFKPVGSDLQTGFEGIFYGRNRTVSNLYIDRDGEQYVGLFGAISSSSSVSNLTLANASVSGQREVGIMVGKNNGVVSQNFVSGDLAADFNNGGVAGANSGSIEQVFASVEVSGANDRTGGLVGTNEGDGEINSTYVSGDVSGSERVAGLVGYNDGFITESYSVAKISGSVDVGGAIGENSRSGSSSDIYWDSLTSNQATGIGNDFSFGFATSLSTSEMQGSSAETNMAGLDFQDTWTSTFSYPKLSWQKSGSGTQDDPYQIYTCRDLQAMKNDKDAYYELAVDVDCSATTEWNGGSGFEPVGSGFSNRFNGSLSGRDREISDLFIERANRKNVGLFGYMSGNISSVRLERADIIGDLQVGGIAGFIRGKIKKSFVGGKIVGFRNNVGAIAGRANRGGGKVKLQLCRSK